MCGASIRCQLKHVLYSINCLYNYLFSLLPFVFMFVHALLYYACSLWLSIANNTSKFKQLVLLPNLFKFYMLSFTSHTLS